MKLSICTISFRHQLTSIEQLAGWAKANHFDGIELWGVHAKNLADSPQFGKEWLADYGLCATMLSDYLPLLDEDRTLFCKVQLLCRLARHWGAKKIRTFAGTKGSAEMNLEERATLVKKLATVCDWMAEFGITLIVETHPYTYADTVASSCRLVEGVSRDNLKLNFDVLHVWESKADIIDALDTLAPHIEHFHLKNISSADYLDVFSPPNVYSASGSREGIVPLFDGAVDYRAFIEHVNSHENPNLRETDASLEWFGDHCRDTLKRDRYRVQQLTYSYQSTA